METIFESLINSYGVKSPNEAKLAIREILQNLILIGLSRANFFNHASFYGGTALRIFYGLNRYSEDLDFTLNKQDSSFSLKPFMKSIIDTCASYGLEVTVDIKNKKVNTPIESTFAKLNTYMTFISAKLDGKLTKHIHKDELLKVKFEVDYNSSLSFNIENKWITYPEIASINVLDLESLFAGKIHAILCRNYKNNVKGRDFYDFIFFINKGIKPNMTYLKDKLVASKVIKEDDDFSMDVLKKLLLNRFNQVDFSKIEQDAKNFTIRSEDLSLYCKELFIDCLGRL